MSPMNVIFDSFVDCTVHNAKVGLNLVGFHILGEMFLKRNSNAFPKNECDLENGESVQDLYNDLNQASSHAINHKLVKNAITLLKNDSNILPLNHDRKRKTASLVIGDKNNIKDILNPYFTTKKNGTGLGLSIVNKIINDHNGEINFVSISNGAKIEIIFN